MKPEEKVRKAILKYLKQLRLAGKPLYYEQRTEVGYKYKKGLPDIWLVYNGQHVEVEIKAEDGERSAMQDKYRLVFKRLNCPCITVKSLTELMRYMMEKFGV